METTKTTKCKGTRKTTKSQKKALSTKGKAIMKEAKKIQKANPKMKWTDAVSKAGKKAKEPQKGFFGRLVGCLKG